MGILSSRDGYLHAQGLKLALSSFGDPAAPPVIFAHGGGQTRHAWSGAAKTVKVKAIALLPWIFADTVKVIGLQMVTTLWKLSRGTLLRLVNTWRVVVRDRMWSALRLAD
jgi:pimeloyl-ACP methyl ester carboxylesterase